MLRQRRVAGPRRVVSHSYVSRLRCVLSSALLSMLLSVPVTRAFAANRNVIVPLGLPPVAMAKNLRTNQRVINLGRELFADPRLSADGEVSCSKCHVQSLGFADGRARPLGHNNQPGTRNAPSLLNVVYLSSLFWDGRAPNLQAQALAPLTNPVEQAFSSKAQVATIVRRIPSYERGFREAFNISPGHIDASLVARALSAYERTLLAGDSPFDRYFYGHDASALSPSAVRGLALFRGRARCATCHTIGPSYALFTDGRSHISPMGLPSAVTTRLGQLTRLVVDTVKGGDHRQLERLIATDADVAALGRFVVTLNPQDIGKFETPSLRNVALTAPYMHDGSVATLNQAADDELYRRGSDLNYPIALTVSERHDLVAFLEALTSPNVLGADSTKAATTEDRPTPPH